MPKIYYGCDLCADSGDDMEVFSSPEDLRVLSDGNWVCDDCFHEVGSRFRAGGEEWKDNPYPPVYVSGATLKTAFTIIKDVYDTSMRGYRIGDNQVVFAGEFLRSHDELSQKESA